MKLSLLSHRLAVLSLIISARGRKEALPLTGRGGPQGCETSKLPLVPLPPDVIYLQLCDPRVVCVSGYAQSVICI
jgi:hypothetical protein